ncbi:MFS transporter, partial [Streptomyces sp. NPDC089733]
MTTAEPRRAETAVGLVGSEQDIGRRSGPETGGSPAGIKNWCRRHPVLLTTAVAALTHLLWFFFFANSGGDLAAQDAWAEFVGRHPGTAYNLAWYGGMHPVSYSVVSPYLMSV